jgi:Uma2 family endonuclease
MSAIVPAGQRRPPGDRGVPPPETGDHLSREEFFRRCEAHPEIPHVERIEGVVYVAAALRLDQHAEPHSDLIAWLNTYRSKTRGLRIGTAATTKLDIKNDFQPDGVLFVPKRLGGQADVDARGYIIGAPDLAAEVSASTASMDLQTKKTVYRRNGVREYLVWRVEEDAIDWFALQNGEYVLIAANESEVLRSTIFPGLWLDVPALIDGDLQRVLETLNEGLATLEHAAFAQSLRERGGKS